jgi:hypothetical protein
MFMYENKGVEHVQTCSLIDWLAQKDVALDQQMQELADAEPSRFESNLQDQLDHVDKLAKVVGKHELVVELLQEITQQKIDRIT